MLDVMDLIMSGSLQDNEIEEFLIAMNEKGASINEISSAENNELKCHPPLSTNCILLSLKI